MPRLDVVTEPNGHTPPPPPPGPVRDAPPGSVLARLRERAAQQRADRTLDVAVWDDLLIARYGLPPMEDADRLMAAAASLVSDQGVPASMSRTAVDLMATCLRGLYGVNDTGGLEDLEHHHYTGRLLTLLELPLPPGVEDAQDATVAEVIATLFNGNWLAVNVHAAKVMTWLQEGGDGLGEGSGAT